MQGFFVQAENAGDLGMNNEVRLFNGTGNWLKSAHQQVSKLSVGVKSDAGYGSDEIQLKFGHEKNENGAKKLFSKVLSAPSLYMTSYEAFLSVLYLTNTNENPVVPMNFTPGVNGKYTISCDFDPGMFVTVLLEDIQTHIIQNMKTEKSYSFYASKTDRANRFIMHFVPMENQPVVKFPATIYSNGHCLIIDLNLISKETEVFVYDIMGKTLLQRKLQGETSHALAIDTYSQILVIYLKNPDGSLCEKMFWNGN